ncbi:MAG: hypothetical protein JWO25_3742 [Alphaproteobacteria bacterium]|nr:hypothetical protein [Alphaproteobacteria bacterium]
MLVEVRRFVARLAPEPACDDRIADRLGLPTSEQASHETRALAGSEGFERRKAACSLCGGETLVIRKA